MFREEPYPRKKSPRTVAVIETDQCTGCEVCIDFCPVDCIDILPGPALRTLNRVVSVNEDVCIGCNLCAKYCPWETIPMLPYSPRVDSQDENKDELNREFVKAGRVEEDKPEEADSDETAEQETAADNSPEEAIA